MTEELDDEKRTWYLKGYAQAEADLKGKVMTEQEKIHLKACDFANKCQNETNENRKQQNLKPYNHSEQQAAWLNHYDGFMAGYIQRIMDFDELIKDRPQLVRCQNENGEDVLKWVKPSNMESKQ